MTEENRNYGNQNRSRHSGGNAGRRNYRGGRGGNFRGKGHQRPLLTSATVAAGASLIAMCFLVATNPWATQLLALATLSFSLSSFVSYVAQRVKHGFVEKLSDLFFILGLGLWVFMATQIGGLV